MKKSDTIIYRIVTGWLALGMLSTAAVQLPSVDEDVKTMRQLGYPAYLLAIIGTCKIPGTIAVLLLKTPLLEEWAYAGFFFAMSGAAVSHIIAGNLISQILPSLLLLTLTALSRYFRPTDRRVVLLTLKQAS